MPNEAKPFLTVDGIDYTEEQVCAAVVSSQVLLGAYAAAEPERGGGESVDWSDLDRAHENARDSMDPQTLEKYLNAKFPRVDDDDGDGQGDNDEEDQVPENT